MANHTEDSDDALKEREQYFQIKYKLRVIEADIKELNAAIDDYEDRIRELEDYKLVADNTHKTIVKTVTILATVISAIISLAEHLLLK